MREFRIRPALLLVAALSPYLAGCPDGPKIIRNELDLAVVPPDLSRPPPDLASVCGECAELTPLCDTRTKKCVACLSDSDCPDQFICKVGACVSGCAKGHDNCGDAGSCDLDAGVCHGCLSDKDCREPGKTSCDVVSGRCGACNPQNDKCPAGSYCVVDNGAPACVPGCRADIDCQFADGGGASSLCCNHVCIDTAVSAANCGACGAVCNGTCCGGKCADTQNDLKNCGSCGKICPVQNNTPSCKAGVCSTGACLANFADCDGNPGNGCETPVGGDVNNCGACNNACALPNAVQLCLAGKCIVGACQKGYTDCDLVVMNGCEVNTGADPMNCGVCGQSCAALPQANAGCANGACVIASCKAGFADCNKLQNDGCEVDVRADAKNCGACGKACVAPANVAVSCVNSACVVGACLPGFADCNNNMADGCEVNLNTDIKNCGVCGTLCQGMGQNAVAGCNKGVCGLACNAGFGDCDMNAGNGCEVNVNGDPLNCGACGTICPQNTPFCTLGKCNNTLKTCKEIYDSGIKVSGQYTIDPDGVGVGVAAYTVYCDMVTDGGGWTLLLNRLTMSDNTGQPDLNKTTGVFDDTRATNWTYDVTPFYASAKDFVFAVKHNNKCGSCAISQYDSAIKVPRSAGNAFSIACPAIEGVQATKLVGPSAGQVLTAYRCTGSLGWGSCPNVCHWGVHGSNTLSDGSWSQNTAQELHFPSAYSSYRSYVNAGGYCRSCGGGLASNMYNPLSSTCCNASGSPDNSNWTMWVR